MCMAAAWRVLDLELDYTGVDGRVASVVNVDV